ncbi:hypothetical protein GQ42DRAFT_155609 [Ramicandelaber brevisporus]|nr:hypothetical protein GQ42DRAFT_155609 [Ramicandelaber brevisporus]
MPVIPGALTSSNESIEALRERLLGRPLSSSVGSGQTNRQRTTASSDTAASDSGSNLKPVGTDELPKSHRIIKPGGLVTMDYRSNRLNVHVNKDGVISSLHYG